MELSSVSFITHAGGAAVLNRREAQVANPAIRVAMTRAMITLIVQTTIIVIHFKPIITRCGLWFGVVVVVVVVMVLVVMTMSMIITDDDDSTCNLTWMGPAGSGPRGGNPKRQVRWRDGGFCLGSVKEKAREGDRRRDGVNACMLRHTRKQQGLGPPRRRRAVEHH